MKKITRPRRISFKISVLFFALSAFFLAREKALADSSTATSLSSSTQSSTPSAAEATPPAKKSPKEIKKSEPTALNPNSSLDRKAEWDFLKTGTTPQNKEDAAALARAVDLFIAANPDSPKASKALALLAQLDTRVQLREKALMDYLRLIYEYPNSSEILEAQSNFLSLAKKTFGRRLKPGWEELATPPQNATKEERLAALLQLLPKDTGGLFCKSAWREFRRFEVRFPQYPHSDSILLNLAQIFEQDSRPREALVFFRELLSAYPQSLSAPDAEFQIAFIYEQLGDYPQAIGSYQKLITDYPQNSQLLPALQSLASLFSEKLGEWTLAIQTDQKIVQLFPKTQAERHALENAVHASKKLSDFKGEAAFLVELADDFPQSREAALSLYRAAGIYYKTIKDAAQAEKLYQRYLSYSGRWYDPASWWRRHRARHRLGILSPNEAPSASPKSGAAS